MLYATLLLCKKVGEKWSADELVPLKSIKSSAKDGNVLLSFTDGSSKTVKLE